MIQIACNPEDGLTKSEAQTILRRELSIQKACPLHQGTFYPKVVWRRWGIFCYHICGRIEYGFETNTINK